MGSAFEDTVCCQLTSAATTDSLFRILGCSSFVGVADRGNDYQASTDQVGMCIAGRIAQLRSAGVYAHDVDLVSNVNLGIVSGVKHNLAMILV